jgi:DNA invertase Pin-like site-specific DNA recombinase
MNLSPSVSSGDVHGRWRGLAVLRARFERRWRPLKRQIRAARAAGVSANEIARGLGLSQSAVYKAIKRWGLDQ